MWPEAGRLLLGGLGLGTIYAEIDGFGSDTETGAGALLGLGWDIRVGSNVSLTPSWNASRLAPPTPMPTSASSA